MSGRLPGVTGSIPSSAPLSSRPPPDLGNRHAAAGDFKKAVIFYTDAIKYNPREYK